MLFMILKLFSFMTNFFFLYIKNPLFSMNIIIAQMIIICYMIGQIYESYWFSYIMFLIYIGGMMIILMYIISYIKIKKFNIFTYKTMLMIYWLLIMTLMIYSEIMMESFIINNNEMKLLTNNNFISLNYENSLNMLKLYNFPTNFINLLMISYLFLLLIITEKTTKFYQGPLRINK